MKPESALRATVVALLKAGRRDLARVKHGKRRYKYRDLAALLQYWPEL